MVSLNIEGSRHLDRVVSFLNKKNPKIIMLQEVFETDVVEIAKKLKLNYCFSPMTLRPDNQKRHPGLQKWGLSILSFYPIENYHEYFYVGSKNIIPRFREKDHGGVRKVLLIAKVKFPESTWNLCNTHFTWTPDGFTSVAQKRDIVKLLKHLKDQKELVLCGDFNAPRGREIWSRISDNYKDNIPSHITTTIDGSLHRAGDLQLVVDGLFSSPNYKITNVKVHTGLSDHCAISANVSR